jgi:hypothetical protein
MAKDSASATDQVEAGLSNEATPPTHPCPACGVATLDANTYEDRMAERRMRICSSESCRAKADWTSGSPVLLNN